MSKDVLFYNLVLIVMYLMLLLVMKAIFTIY